jgi:predicted  nucleic acid-binding Zn-ribbon protein
LFPVREKIVEVPKTNYTAYAITGVAVGAIVLVIGILGYKFFNNTSNEIETDEERCARIRNSLEYQQVPIETVSDAENMEEDEALPLIETSSSTEDMEEEEALKGFY